MPQGGGGPARGSKDDGGGAIAFLQDLADADPSGVQKRQLAQSDP
jgi:hypothetical protein